MAAALNEGFHAILAGLGGFWSRIKSAVLIALVIVLALAALVAFVSWLRDRSRNETIVRLTHNHDVAVSQDATPKLIFARAYFLMTHGKLDDAQALVSLFDLRGSARARADLHYDLGNWRLLRAFEKIDSADFDAAGALVGLAQEDYIEALRLDPDDWNARYNFDVAARLVRQYPSFVNSPDARRQGPHPVWTELPNTPRGEP